MYRLEVLNPVAQLRADMKATSTIQTLARRPSTLDGKVVGLLWDGMGRGEDTLKAIGEMFTHRFKDVEIKFYQGGHPTAPPVLQRLAAECDVAVGGFAD